MLAERVTDSLQAEAEHDNRWRPAAITCHLAVSCYRDEQAPKHSALAQTLRATNPAPIAWPCPNVSLPHAA